MSFAVEGRYLWDFWTVRDDATTHMFYLNAPRDIPHPDERHGLAVIGHATSADLRNWTDHGVCLGPSPKPAWDDGTTWTGSTIKRPDGQWMMFYTGTTRQGGINLQRIGAALSSDLHNWEKLPQNPVLTTDPRWYEVYDFAAKDERPWHDEAWRDPWVYPDPAGKGWRMLFTAREKAGPDKGRGVIAQATSPDLLNWTAGEPFFRIGHFGEMEVPQLFQIGAWWYCLFCNGAKNQAASYQPFGGAYRHSGTHYLRARSPNGPFEMCEDRFLAGDPAWRLYAGRMVPGEGGRLYLMSFLNELPDGGGFGGTISDPMRLWQLPDGRLRTDTRAYGIPVPPEDLAHMPGD